MRGAGLWPATTAFEPVCFGFRRRHSATIGGIAGRCPLHASCVSTRRSRVNSGPPQWRKPGSVKRPSWSDFTRASSQCKRSVLPPTRFEGLTRTSPDEATPMLSPVSIRAIGNLSLEIAALDRSRHQAGESKADSRRYQGAFGRIVFRSQVLNELFAFWYLTDFRFYFIFRKTSCKTLFLLGRPRAFFASR